MRPTAKGSRQPAIYTFSLLSRKCSSPDQPPSKQLPSDLLSSSIEFITLAPECPYSDFSKRNGSNHYRAPKTISILASEKLP